MAYNLEDETPSFVIEVDFLKGEKGDTGFSPRIEIASLTSAEYILKIVNEDGEFYTPNLKSDLSLEDYVLKEEGKGLSTNSFEHEEKQKLQELHNYDDTELRSQVLGLTEAIGKINSFDVKIVDELPTENIDVHTIYFIPNEQDEKNYYDEYLYVDGKWEHIGTSEVDLTGHVTKDDLGKTYTGTNITAPTVAGYGRIKKLYGKTIEEGTGEKSPDNPYKLRCVADDINLFNKDGDKTGIYINASGVEEGSDVKLVYIKQIITPTNSKYTMSYKAYVGESYVRLSYFNGNTFISREVSNQNGHVFTIPNNCTKIDVRVDDIIEGSSSRYFEELKIQEGSVATPYSSYGYGTVENISTDGTNTSSNVVVTKPLCSLGDVRDELDYNKNKIIRRLELVVVDGDEGIDSGSKIEDMYLYTIDLTGKKGTQQNACISTHYPYASGNENYEHIRINGDGNIVIFSKVSTLDAFKTWLASNPVTIIYSLATPTIEDIECSDKIVQYNGTTNVYNRDGAEIEVSLNNSEVISDINENLKNIENPTSEDFQSKVAFNETPANISFRKTGNLVTIIYQGENKVHTANEVLFTLPSEYKPLSNIFTPFVQNAHGYGVILINTSGSCQINQLSNTTNSGRVYFSVTYPIA